jgi:putative FmdB family regulatory protein
MRRVMYEFQCPECGEYKESLVSDPVVDAPACPHNHGQMKKILSTPTFHFANGQGTDMGNAYAFRGRPLWGG